MPSPGPPIPGEPVRCKAPGTPSPGSGRGCEAGLRCPAQASLWEFWQLHPHFLQNVNGLLLLLLSHFSRIRHCVTP